MKYIRFNDVSVVIFTDDLKHSNIAEKLHINKTNIDSAGYIKLRTDGTVNTFGESISLNISSNPEVDSRYITTMMIM
jgi:hypothetical protein